MSKQFAKYLCEIADEILLSDEWVSVFYIQEYEVDFSWEDGADR